MEIKIDFTRKDFLEFNKYVFLKKRIKKSISIAVFFILLWLIIMNLNKPFSPILILTELVVFSLVWVLFMFLSYKFSFFRISKMPDDKGEILGEKTYILTDDGLKQVSEYGESFVKWIGIKSLEENENYLFIFVDKIAAYVIPKRYFSNMSETKEFIKTLNENIKK
jgi:YcxB-like protein